MKSVFLTLFALALSTPVLSVSVWGQCGGIGFTGSTVCDTGSVCSKQNDYYSQCIPGTATVAPPASPPSTTVSAPAPSSSLCPGARTKFSLFGVNESGAEFGNNVVPGTLGKDFTWPAPSSIDFFVGQGFNAFRIPFLMERMSPPATGLTGPLDQTYLSGLKTIVNYITGKGGFAIIDPHNFMIFNGKTISSTSELTLFAGWKTLSNEFKDNKNVVFDVMNEPHDIPAATVASLMQAAINGIRSSGATSQLILVEGTSWTGAWTWTSSGNAAAFAGLKDPNNNFAIQMHQYLDSDGSGTSPTCVSPTIGAERIADATAWLKANNLRGFLGEIGAGSNAACITAVQGALCSMQQSGVWLGALWWAAGPWWADYYQSIEPPTGAAVSQILPQALKPFIM
ncbi:glycoside hydrolase superfamily [Cristinia sonorae]|uniref:cellulase n=1 Tax=Cristinia sonorae TaxID=1940300 RepID=A0A8K0UKW5_9AGAR|nr:glycoside hydrolase superfamily [Cristinia sonorae]